VTRRTIASVILVLWGVALALLAHKEFGKSDAQRIAEAAAHIYPTTYYYLMSQGSTPIASVSSQMDTVVGQTRGFRLVNQFRGRLPFADTLGFINGLLVAYLSRQFVLDSFSLAMTAGQPQVRTQRLFPQSPRALPPGLVPMMFMMSGAHKLGRSESYRMYNPLADSVSTVTLRMAAESLFTVSDSAIYDSTRKQWVSAHTDTVRSWSLAPSIPGIAVWVDMQGRIVSAAGPSGVHLIRTAYEIAFANLHSQHP
jgi:hypothetical protein